MMERSDFVDRNGERKIDFLKYYGLIETLYAKEHGLTLAELRLLTYLDAIPYFTREDFKNGTLFYTWDNKRFNKLKKFGWIVVVENCHRALGNHNHYNLSVKGTIMVNTIYKILCNEIPLPQKYKRLKKGATYTAKARVTAIEEMEKIKARERLDNY